MWLRSKNWVKGVVVLAVVALCLLLILPLQQKIKLGLDLQGGVRVLLQLQTSPEVTAITPQVQAQVEQVIQNRINGLGVSEPQISRVGTDRLLVELPNVKNPDEAVKTLKEVATLDFKIVPDKVEPARRRRPKVCETIRTVHIRMADLRSTRVPN